MSFLLELLGVGLYLVVFEVVVVDDCLQDMTSFMDKGLTVGADVADPEISVILAAGDAN